MGYSGRLIDSLVSKRGGNTASRLTAEQAEHSIDARYGHVDEHVEYEHVPFSSRWVAESDFGKSVRKSSKVKSPHSLAGIKKPKRESR